MPPFSSPVRLTPDPHDQRYDSLSFFHIGAVFPPVRRFEMRFGVAARVPWSLLNLRLLLLSAFHPNLSSMRGELLSSFDPPEERFFQSKCRCDFR